MSGEPLGEGQLETLFEAARWAPSSGNSQPWRILYARRDGEHWPLFLGLLDPSNQEWANRAAALLMFLSKDASESGRLLPTHSYDTGSAWMSLALQGWRLGLVVHGMAGFDYARAKADLRVPPGFTVEAMAAVGKPGRVEDLSEKNRAREHPSSRRPVEETIHEGPYPSSSAAPPDK